MAEYALSGGLKKLFKQALRFLFFGLVNTGLTIVVYQLALFALTPLLSYTMAWVVGIVFVAVFYPTKVFGSRDPSRKRVALYCIQYVTVFLIGALFLQFMIGQGVNERTVILAIAVLTAAINFLVGRFIFVTK